MVIMGETLAAASAAGGQYRQPIVVAAIEITAHEGWSAVTMARLAESVGVSRQTVYNEVGSKAALAEAMVGHELDRFLALVRGAFDRHPHDLPGAVFDAVRGVLDLAGDNVLLRAVASATHGADTELLPLLTTRAEALITEATAILTERVRSYPSGASSEQLDVVVDVVVRAVLSHVMQPSDTPERTADGLAWLVRRALGDGAAGPPLRYAGN
ncbi:TetR/AcrR family transcriptional regulator [Prauserella alba]|nr:TetR family transcriptional regulator [Prauserella alba]